MVDPLIWVFFVGFFIFLFIIIIPASDMHDDFARLNLCCFSLETMVNAVQWYARVIDRNAARIN